MKYCSIEGCINKHYAKDYCHFHYNRSLHNIPLDKPKLERNKKCIYNNCNEKYLAKGYCMFHYERIKNNIPLNQQKRIIDPLRSCLVINCTEKYYGKGYCYFHWQRWKNERDLNTPKKINNPTRPCNVLGCTKKYYGLGYCHFHWQRLKNGIPLYKPEKVIYKHCTFKDCNIKSNGRKYCKKHYRKYINPSSHHGGDIYLYIASMNVRKRDKNECRWYKCNKSAIKGDRINVHHIFPKSEYPELMYIEEYMICYCVKHHIKFHKYRGDKCWKFISALL